MATKPDSKAALLRRAKADAKRHEVDAYATLMRCVKAPTAFSPVSIRQAFSYLTTLADVRSILEEVPGMTLTVKVPDGLKGKDSTAFTREALVQRFIEWAVVGGPDLLKPKVPKGKANKVAKMTPTEAMDKLSDLLDSESQDRDTFLSCLSALPVGKSDVGDSLKGLLADAELKLTGPKPILIDRLLTYYGFAPILAPTNTPMMDTDTIVDEIRAASWSPEALERMRKVLEEMSAEQPYCETPTESSDATETALETSAA